MLIKKHFNVQESVRAFVALALLVVVAMGVSREICKVAERNLPAITAEAVKVLNGAATWRASSHRMLPVCAVQVISECTRLDYSASLILYFRILTILFVLLVAGLLIRLGLSINYSVSSACTAGLALLLVQCPRWFMPWDAFDIILMMLCGYGLVARKGCWWFMCLTLAGILNRETILFVGVALAMSGVGRVFKWRRIAVGTLTTGLGAAFTWWYRNLRFSGAGSEIELPIVGNTLWFVQHMQWLASGGWWYGALLLLIFILLISMKRFTAAFMFALLSGSAIAFGKYDETRLYMAPIAFCVIPVFYMDSNRRLLAAGYLAGRKARAA